MKITIDIELPNLENELAQLDTIHSEMKALINAEAVDVDSIAKHPVARLVVLLAQAQQIVSNHNDDERNLITQYLQSEANRAASDALQKRLQRLQDNHALLVREMKSQMSATYGNIHSNVLASLVRKSPHAAQIENAAVNVRQRVQDEIEQRV